MAVIMENFRRYSDDVKNEKDIERMYLLREGRDPQETTLTELLEKRDRGEINFVELVDLMEQSMNYEYDQLVQTESKGLTEGEIHELFGKKRQEKWAKIAAGEDEAPQRRAPTGGGKEKKTIKFAVREKLLTFVYSKVAAAVKSMKGQDEKSLGAVTNNMAKAQAAFKSGNGKEGLKLLSIGAFKAALKPVKLLFQGILKLVGYIAAAVKKVGPLFKHPVVRVLFIGVALLGLLQVTTVSGAVFASYKVVNKVATLATGQSLTGRAVGAVGKAAVQGAAGAIGLEEIEQLNELEEEGLISFAEILGELGANDVAAALIKLGAQLEGQDMLQYGEDDIWEFGDESGDVISLEKTTFATSNEALAAEMGAFGNLRDLLKALQSGDMDPSEMGADPAVAEAMEKALAAGQAACVDDPAHCEGVQELTKAIREEWSGHIKGDITDKTLEFGNETTKMSAEWFKSSSRSIGTTAIKGGGAALAKSGL